MPLNPPALFVSLSLLLPWEDHSLLASVVETFLIQDLSLLPNSLDLYHLRPRPLPTPLNLCRWWWYGIAAIENALYQHQGYTSPQLNWSVFCLWIDVVLAFSTLIAFGNLIVKDKSTTKSFVVAAIASAHFIWSAIWVQKAMQTTVFIFIVDSSRKKLSHVIAQIRAGVSCLV